MKIELHNQDCMGAMAEMEDNAFDLAIVDPPYGINANNMSMGSTPNKTSTAVKLKKGRLNQGSGKLKNRILNTSDCEWDKHPPDQKYFDELSRVSRNQIVWGGNYFPLPPTRGIICWDKLQPWDNFSQFELAWTSFDKPARMFRRSNTGGANFETKIHPTQKPVKLYEWLLINYAKEGDKILDTHCGSGSIMIACHRLGFDLQAYEIDVDYYNAAQKRFKEQTSQVSMLNEITRIEAEQIKMELNGS